METKLKIIQPNGEETEVTLDMAPRPTLHDIQAVLAPYFGRAYTERVNVLVGKSYTEILRHYYNDVHLVDVNSLDFFRDEDPSTGRAGPKR